MMKNEKLEKLLLQQRSSSKWKCVCGTLRKKDKVGLILFLIYINNTVTLFFKLYLRSFLHLMNKFLDFHSKNYFAQYMVGADMLTPATIFRGSR